jgi:DNA-binding transcriptional MerR regulator
LEIAERLGLTEIAAKVDFSTEQVARMCAVSRRQLAYWAQKGIIPSEEGYSLATVEKVTLIRRELAKGHTLKRAVQRAEKRLEERRRFEGSLQNLALDDFGVLCAAHLERVESLLLTVRDLTGRLTAEEQLAVRETIASLRLQEVLGAESASLSPSEILVCLHRAVEHLELVLEDLRDVV